MTAPRRSSGEVRVALLRGINVGGRNRLPMAELVKTLETAGCTDVRTYIQSGNAVFCPPAGERDLQRRLAAAILERHGLDVPVVIRTGTDLARVVRSNPFLTRGMDPKQLSVAFLAGVPAPERIAALDPDRSPPDEFVVSGSEIYLHFPNGIARSKLTNAWLDSRLKTVSTVRNWRTTLKLLAMASGE